MKITIELNNDEVLVFGNWTSVLETLNGVEAVFAIALGERALDEPLVWRCRDLVGYLAPRLGGLHQQVREQIWIQHTLTADPDRPNNLPPGVGAGDDFYPIERN